MGLDDRTLWEKFVDWCRDSLADIAVNFCGPACLYWSNQETWDSFIEAIGRGRKPHTIYETTMPVSHRLVKGSLIFYTPTNLRMTDEQVARWRETGYEVEEVVIITRAEWEAKNSARGLD